MNTLVAVSLLILPVRPLVELVRALRGYFYALDEAYQHMILDIWLITGIGLIGLFSALIATDLYMAW